MLTELKTTLLAHGLSDTQLETILNACSKETFSQGEQLCSEDDVLDKLYIILTGCVKAFIGPKDNKRVADFMNAGEAFGHYCVLMNEPVMADLYAEFETTVLCINRSSVLQLIEEIPQLQENLSRSFRKRLKVVMQGNKIRRFARIVAFVRTPHLEPKIISEVAVRLSNRGEQVVIVSKEASQNSSVETVTAKSGENFSHQIHELQSRFDRIVLDLTANSTEDFFQSLRICNEVIWCFRSAKKEEDLELLEQFFEQTPELATQVKRVCLLPSGQRVAPLGTGDNRIKKRDFILPLNDTGDDFRMHRQGIDRITRHLCDVKIGLSLAGGGARGLVHFGILRALDEAGISFDFMSGTSAGSMFGLSYATGLETDYLIDAYHQNLTPPKCFRWLPNGDKWYLVWKFRSLGWDKMLRGYFDHQFEQLQIPFSSVAVDLVAGKQLVSESGDIIQAMLASLNLPIISKPILRNGMALVDGGILNNLPADILVQKKADYVVGVVVSSDLEPKFGKNRPEMDTAEMKHAGRLETMFRLLEVMGSGSKAAQRSAIDLLIRPDTSAFSFTDFTQGKGLAAVGESVMKQSIPELRTQLDELMRFQRK
ncbi:MAG: cyclic nucleotide-binding and patatin-like phospholipase domain-containing protein [Mariniblastus sp.]|nr:cyclic nucleotide-binding and patatin-like phospholipase domain-containing protein [Mariniblastus sp.]